MRTTAGDLDQRRDHRELHASPSTRPRPFHRSVAGREARRRPLRRRDRRRVLRRIDVPPPSRRLEDRPARFSRAPPEAALRSSRHPMAHPSSATIRRHRNPPRRLPPSSHHGGELAAKFRGLTLLAILNPPFSILALFPFAPCREF